jgi:hypothetical protein
MTVDAFIYTGPSLLNQFFCDSAIIDKTLFYEIINLAWFSWPFLKCNQPTGMKLYDLLH